MQFRRPHGSGKASGNSSRLENNVVYPVPYKTTSGKPITRHPAPSFSPPPLHDDFDAITHGSQSNYKATEPFSLLRKRPALAVNTNTRPRGPPAPPRPADITTSTTKTAQPKYPQFQRFRDSWKEKSFFANPLSLPFQGHRSPKGKERGDYSIATHDTRPEHDRHYSTDMSREYPPPRRRKTAMAAVPLPDPYSGGGPSTSTNAPNNISHQRSRGQHDTTRMISEGHTTDLSMTRSMANARDLMQTRRDGGSGNGGGRPPPARDAPAPGQTYEMVGKEVVESDPTKTVTISTWRQQVAKATIPPEVEGDSMSIYFISADQLAQHEQLMSETTKILPPPPELAPPIGPVKKTHGGPGSLKSTSSSGSDTQTSMKIQGEGFSILKPPPKPQHQRKLSGGQRTHLEPPPSLGHTKTISRSTSHPHSATTDSQGFLKPPRDTHTATSMEDSEPTRHPRKRYVESTPLHQPGEVTETLHSPFHPTQSGSTITSIRSSAAPEVKRALEECQPSLVHILPVVAKLGITTLEHMRAISKLKPTTRDREVKEHALGMGITVVEWAILLDKIFELSLSES